MVEEESYNRNNKERERFETHTHTNKRTTDARKEGSHIFFLPLTRGSLLGLL
jgi:hypothetical protein